MNQPTNHCHQDALRSFGQGQLEHTLRCIMEGFAKKLQLRVLATHGRSKSQNP